MSEVNTNISEDENDPKYTSMNALSYAMNGQPTEFEQEVHGSLADRIFAEIEKKREEVARSIFGSPEQEVEASDNDAEESDSEEADESELEADESEVEDKEDDD